MTSSKEVMFSPPSIYTYLLIVCLLFDGLLRNLVGRCAMGQEGTQSMLVPIWISEQIQELFMSLWNLFQIQIKIRI